MEFLSLVVACAPFVAPSTMMSIVAVESSGNSYAIGVNSKHRANTVTSHASAVNEAKRLIANGANIDMGLMQINVKTMKNLGLTVEQTFDPCTNLYAGATVLTRNYYNASRRYVSEQDALLAAISAYNTGNYRNGFKNGYVGKVVNKATKYSKGH
jgi:type IV secretion system protein VirB1